jgi:hypothetical protein
MLPAYYAVVLCVDKWTDVCVCVGGGVCMSTQKMHPANPSTIQSCDSPKYVVLEVCFCPMPGAQRCRDITGYSTVEDH